MKETETIHSPVSQQLPPTNQPTTPVSSRKDNSIYKYLFLITVVVLLGVIAGFYFVLNNKANKINNQTIAETTSIPTQTIVDNKIVTSTPTVASTKSTLTEKDSTHSLYTNNKFGFSVVVPKLTLGSIECKKETDSYRPANGPVPVTFFENDDTIYLAADNFYRLTGEQKTPDSRSNFSGCEKLKTTFELIEKGNEEITFHVTSLKIYANSIKNDAELEQFIKSKYGSACKLGEKTLSENSDFYNVKILGDGKDLSESQCPINFIVNTKYNPTKGVVVMFELGQACNLFKDSTGINCYDQEIVSSLKFN